MAFTARQIEAQLAANEKEMQDKETLLQQLPPAHPQRAALESRLKMLQRAQQYWEAEWSKITGIRFGTPTVVAGEPEVHVPPQNPAKEMLDPGPEYQTFADYIDNVVAGHYDVATGKFTVDHANGTTIELDYHKILQDLQAPPSPTVQKLPSKVLSRLKKLEERGDFQWPVGQGTISVSGGVIVYYRDRRTNKIYPHVFDAHSAPNIVAMVREIETARGDAELLLQLGQLLLTVPIAGPLGGRAPSLGRAGRVVPKGPAPAVRGFLGITGKMARLGQMGADDCLISSVQTAGKRVVYRVDAISAMGADAARIRAAHRAMLRTAAEEALAAGQTEFTMIGKQANANFRRHADKLAREVGVAQSGRQLSGVPPLNDYEVTLDVAKVLASNVE